MAGARRPAVDTRCSSSSRRPAVGSRACPQCSHPPPPITSPHPAASHHLAPSLLWCQAVLTIASLILRTHPLHLTLRAPSSTAGRLATPAHRGKVWFPTACLKGQSRLASTRSEIAGELLPSRRHRYPRDRLNLAHASRSWRACQTHPCLPCRREYMISLLSKLGTSDENRQERVWDSLRRVLDELVQVRPCLASR
eukprot:5438251-Prymnesium_polylepis.2